MEYVLQVLGTALIAVLAPIILVIIFWKPMAAKIVDSHEFQFKWGKLKLRFKGKETDEILQSLFSDMRVLIDKVPPKERKRVIEMVEKSDGTITVGKIYRNFERESDAHNYLRGLRDAQFIRPVRSGRFKEDSKLEMKDFGKLMLKYQRKYILTDDAA